MGGNCGIYFWKHWATSRAGPQVGLATLFVTIVTFSWQIWMRGWAEYREDCWVLKNRNKNFQTRSKFASAASFIMHSFQCSKNCKNKKRFLKKSYFSAVQAQSEDNSICDNFKNISSFFFYKFESGERQVGRRELITQGGARPFW